MVAVGCTDRYLSCTHSTDALCFVSDHYAQRVYPPAALIAACDDEVIPLQERIEAITDEANLAHVYETERHLLSVACTRARDHLLITCVDPGSEFLDDIVF